MASSGIRRKVDDLGRVVIPAGMRRTLGIREGDAVEVSVEGERVVLAKPRDACVFCGREEEELTGFRGRLVCRDCLGSLGSVQQRLQASAAATSPTPSDALADPRVSGAPASSPEQAAPPREPQRATTPASPPEPPRPEPRREPRPEPRPAPRPEPPYDPASTTAW